MNLASAGPLCFLWLRWDNRLADDSQNQVGRLRLQMFRWSVAAYLLGMVLGVLLWLVLPGDGLAQALARFPSRAFGFAAAELLFSLVCMLPLALDWRFLQGRSWLSKLLAVMSATNLLYHFPPLMAIVGQLASNPHWAKEPVLDRSVLLNLMAQWHVLALSCHFVLASVTVAAMATLWLASQANSAAEMNAKMQKSIRHAGLVALLTTLLQIPVGVWLLASTPAATRTALMGGSLVTSLIFVVAMTGTLILLQRLASIVLGDFGESTLRGACWLVLVIIFLMAATLRWSRPDKSKSIKAKSPAAVSVVVDSAAGRF
ncbi:hypothetical protein Pr1d_24560 [Bythopirellula goksoeyrii]|uniref:Uncharacterized protein n=2 Tax=Bythopirellula goksoeyrii TaxID=1400387 RepID=A0A5B9Q7Z8_9BACT|nr:hypothetical protein Pr1d_24560 [Bythopirellula goksoeyrii]